MDVPPPVGEAVPAVAVGTKRQRDGAVSEPTGQRVESGLEAFAAQSGDPVVGTADESALESGAHESRHVTSSNAPHDPGKPSTSMPVGVAVHVGQSIGTHDKQVPPQTNGTHTTLTPSKSNKQKRQCFRYGNYHRYYGYRVGETLEDHRVTHFKDEWFTNKRILDIGCNEGLVGLSLAVRCAPTSLTGIDIDHFLVKKAKDKLIRLINAGKAQGREAKKKEKETNGGDNDSKARSAEDEEKTVTAVTPEDVSLANALPALKNVTFKHCNVLDEDFGNDSLDAVLCLSVTKWIQLNWGDEGLKKLFRNIYSSLSPGGIFLVEPQPWKSYKQAFKKQAMPEECRVHFKSIKIKPAMYADVLQNEIGFDTVETLRDADMEGASEFDRTVLLCVKKK